MKVGVTGATGFLGSHVVRLLAAAGHRVRALVRPGGQLDVGGNRGIEKVTGDLFDRAALRRLAIGADAVVHAAGLVSVRPRDEEDLYRVNVEGTRNVLEAARRAGARMIHASSVAAVGATVAPVVLDENAPFRLVAPRYHYSSSKRSAEELALAKAQEGADVVILNPGMLFGPGDARFTSTLPVREYLQGQMRFYPEGGMSFCDVRDVAAAFTAALDKGRSGERYIVAGVNWTYRELFETLWQITGLHRPWPAPWPVTWGVGLVSELASTVFPHAFEGLNRSVAKYARLFNYCDSSKAMRELGYAPRDFRDTLRDTIDDHVARGAVRSPRAGARA